MSYKLKSDRREHTLKLIEKIIAENKEKYETDQIFASALYMARYKARRMQEPLVVRKLILEAQSLITKQHNRGEAQW